MSYNKVLQYKSNEEYNKNSNSKSEYYNFKFNTDNKLNNKSLSCKKDNLDYLRNIQGKELVFNESIFKKFKDKYKNRIYFETKTLNKSNENNIKQENIILNNIKQCSITKDTKECNLLENQNSSEDDNLFGDINILNKTVDNDYQNKEIKVDLLSNSDNKIKNNYNINNTIDKLYNDNHNNNNKNNSINQHTDLSEEFIPTYIKKEDRIGYNQNAISAIEDNNIKQTNEIIRKNEILEILKDKKEDVSFINSHNKDTDIKDSLNMLDDTDDIDDLEEFKNWKLRQNLRLKQIINSLKEKQEEKDDIERRRNLTDNQRTDENLKLGNAETVQPFKRKYTYMQKYIAKPAFFQDEAQNDVNHIFNRDINIPTEDEFKNIENLPKILQKRKGDYGKKGLSKHTHLVDVDTTDFNPEFKISEEIQKKLLKKSAGYK